MTITGISTSVVRVEFGPSPGSPGVTVYKASIGLNSCEAAATASPLLCSITGLPPGTSQTVSATACLATGSCSSVISGQGFTLPEGIVKKKL